MIPKYIQGYSIYRLDINNPYIVSTVYTYRHRYYKAIATTIIYHNNGLHPKHTILTAYTLWITKE